MRTFNKAVASLFAVVLAGSLAFGASTAFARPSAASDCPVDLDQGLIGYACTTNADCYQPCIDQYGDVSFGGSCRFGGCCRCSY